MRGTRDLYGRNASIDIVGTGDELAAADPGDGTGNEGTPIVLVKGLAVPPQSGNARCLVRPLSEDLFQ